MTKPLYLSVREFNSTPISFPKKFNLQEDIKTFEKNPSGKSSVVLVPFKDSKTDSKFTLGLKGELFTDGIMVSDEYKTHSIGFRFENEVDANEFHDAASSIFDPLFANDNNDWTYRDFIKNDTDIWLKLKFDDAKTAYNLKSNVRIHPKKPKEAALHSGDPITAIVDMMAYFSLADKTYGITPKVRELIIGEEV